VLFKLKIGDSESKNKRRTIKIKKGMRPSKIQNEGLVEQAANSILDNQLDQLVIHKPPDL